MNYSEKNKMKTFSWLVRREFWENKGLFLWVPVALAFFFFLLFLTVEFVFKGVLSSAHYQTMQEIFGKSEAAAKIVGFTTHHVSDMSRFFLHVLLFAGAFLSSFYLLGALHVDRRDRSILFWKSMPVSELAEVFSKLSFPLLLTPLICLFLAFCSYFFAALLVSVLSIFGPLNLFSTIMLNEDMYKTPLLFFSLIPFYILWSLPTVGWFLMVSSLARSRVFPWAVGLPILCTILLGIVNTLFQMNWDIAWFVKHFLARLIAANIPGSWLLEIQPEAFPDFATNPGSGFFTPELLMKGAWQCLRSPSVWLGAVFGIGMILLAIRIRRYSDVSN